MSPLAGQKTFGQQNDDTINNNKNFLAGFLQIAQKEII